MYATHLVCKGCRPDHPLDARFACDRCFGPLETAYDLAAIATASTASRSGRPCARCGGGPRSCRWTHPPTGCRWATRR